MKLSGTSDSTIMKVGRWMSLTNLTYIHLQIRMLTAGLAWRMSKAFRSDCTSIVSWFWCWKSKESSP